MWFVGGICCLLQLAYVFSTPAFIDPCKSDDSDCIKTSIQKSIPEFMSGVPELDIEVLDPLLLDVIEFELSGLKFKLTNGRVKGWKNVVMDKLVMNTEENTMYLEFHSGFQLRGNYTAGGQLLLLPISGKGEMKFKSKNVRFKMTVPYEIVTRSDDKEHLRLKSYNYEFEETVGAHYTLTNLFDGNKELSSAMHNFLNENWRIVTNEFGGPIIEGSVKKIYANIQTLLAKVPLDELFL